MKLEISIKDVQHVKKIDFSVDFSEKSLVCIAGRNGIGKTTLIKAVRNLISADTFPNTSANRSFSEDSEIVYKIDGKNIVFKYDKTQKILDSKDAIPGSLRKSLTVELPIPHGDRFKFFDKIREVDPRLRTQVVLEKYTKATELINFLEAVYDTKKFENLVEIKIKGDPYYVIPFPDKYYLREDHFSSGEYFLINLYRRIVSGYTAIFIDEIDISLDAAAQVRLVEWLRKFTEIYNTKFVFTTHSLAMMRMLDPNELYYMEEQDNGSIAIEKRSYAFIKSTLFGFTGWDKYILTEDDVLQEFLEHFINNYCKRSFYKNKIIYVGGGTNTTDLMERNRTQNFFSEDENNVIVILDGDQKGSSHSKKPNVFCIPFASVEKELLSRCLAGELMSLSKLEAIVDDYQRLIDFVNGQNNAKRKRVKVWLYSFFLWFKKNTYLRRQLSVANGDPATQKDFKKAGKKLFKNITNSQYTRKDIFDFLISKNMAGMQALQLHLEEFTSLKK